MQELFRRQKQSNRQTSRIPAQGGKELEHALRKGIWQHFHFLPGQPPNPLTSLSAATLIPCPNTLNNSQTNILNILNHAQPRIKPSTIFPLCNGWVISPVPASLASYIITCLPFLPVLFLLFILPYLFWLWSLGNSWPLEPCFPWNQLLWPLCSRQACLPMSHMILSFHLFVTAINLFTSSMVSTSRM